MKKLLVVLVVLVVINGITFVNYPKSEMVQANANVMNMINASTIWTKENSPFTLAEDVLISNGVSLTIEPGVIVNLGAHYIKVNGTLIAKGSSTRQIQFNGGEIIFAENCTGWNELTGSGSIIENAVLNSTTISSTVSLKISKNSISAEILVGASSLVTDNIITGRVTADGSSVVSGNAINGGIVTSSLFSEYPTVISNNTIMDGSTGGRILPNQPVGIEASGFAIVTNNTIVGNNVENSYGVIGEWDVIISNNIVNGWKTGIRVTSDLNRYGGHPLIEKNLVTNNTEGIFIETEYRDWVGTQVPTVRDNTISNNSLGIKLHYVINYLGEKHEFPKIFNNNIQDSHEYNLEVESFAVDNINITYNWWGKTNIDEINRTISNLSNGNVEFVPFLSAPNFEAKPNLNASTPANSTPGPSTSIPEYPSLIILPMVFISTVMFGLFLRKKLRKNEDITMT
jgi:hypothetical protein